MRRILTVPLALLVAALAASAPSVAHPRHQPSEYCRDHKNLPPHGSAPGTPGTPSEVATDELLVDVDGNITAVCITDGPAKGSIVVRHTKGNEGFVMVDGDSTNSGPAAGYLTLQISDNTDRTGVDSRCSGNYDHDRDRVPTPSQQDPTTCL